MRQCLREFLEKLGPKICDYNITINWTSVFPRTNMAPHVIVAEGVIREQILEFNSHRYYPDDYRYSTMEPGVELIDSVAFRKTLNGLRLVVRTTTVT